MCVIGVDFGGTWIQAAVVCADGCDSEIYCRPTVASRPADDILSELVDIVLSIEREAGKGKLPVGFGVPTTIDAGGTLAQCPNLPTMSAYPLEPLLKERLNRPVWLTNDATCFTLGEWRWGAGSETQNMLGITLGTSIGVGIIVEGRSVPGASGQAGEIWRCPVDLLSEDSPDLHSALKGSSFTDNYYARTGRKLEGVSIAKAAVSGDRVAKELFARYGHVLGGCLAWLSNLLDPDVIVLGGSIAESFPLFEPSMISRLGSLRVNVVPSRLGSAAAILGAALPALSE